MGDGFAMHWHSVFVIPILTIALEDEQFKYIYVVCVCVCVNVYVIVTNGYLEGTSFNFKVVVCIPSTSFCSFMFWT